MIWIYRELLIKQFIEELSQLDTVDEALIFVDKDEMATKLINCLETAIIETDKREV